MEKSQFKIEKFNLGDLQTNCYLCHDGTVAVVIDPGGDAAEVILFIEKNSLKLTHIINTHGHGDHIGGNGQLKNRFPEALIICHKDEERMLVSAFENLSVHFMESVVSPAPEKLVSDGDIIDISDNISFLVIHTPGHTKGGISLKSGEYLFSGDTLFLESIGRTDLPGGDFKAIINSIQNKLFPLGDCKVYPGHGPVTSLLHERKFNPFLA